MKSHSAGLLIFVLLVGCTGCTEHREVGPIHDKEQEIQSLREPSTSWQEKKETDHGAEAHVDHAASVSPDGKYRIESFGVIKDVTAGGLYPSEEIRLLDNDTEQVLWSMSPGYYHQSFLWSDDNRYVAVYMETRISGESFVIDTWTMSEIPLPNIEEIRENTNQNTTVHEYRPDPYFRFLHWLHDDQLAVSFLWSGSEGDGYEGSYIFDVTEKKLLEIQFY